MSSMVASCDPTANTPKVKHYEKKQELAFWRTVTFSRGTWKFLRLNPLNLKAVVNQPISTSNPAATEARRNLSSLQQLVIKPIKLLTAATAITL